jgi:hypothetical protein
MGRKIYAFFHVWEVRRSAEKCGSLEIEGAAHLKKKERLT